jgi:hypothetical protein
MVATNATPLVTGAYNVTLFYDVALLCCTSCNEVGGTETS